MAPAAATATSLLFVLTLCAYRASAQAGITNRLVDLIVRRRYDEFVKELSADGMDVNQPDSKGRLPLSEAVRTRDIKYVDALIQFGALANSRDPATKASPLQYAFQNGLLEIAKMLLAYGANINAVDKSGAKPRDFAPTADIRALILKWDKGGAQEFEDPPGTWTKASNDAGEKYWYNQQTQEARWNTPPSCAWQRLEVQGQPHKYTNFVTSQTVTVTPTALAWRLLRQQGQDVWYNWRLNVSQLAQPDELPDDVVKQVMALRNVRWYNAHTGDFAWENPKFQTPWRELQGEDGESYYFNVVTGESAWDAPEELAWRRVPSEEHPGQEFWHNSLTGESTWEQPGHHNWEEHDTDL